LFALAFPKRSAADFDYVFKLMDAGVVDEELVIDVLSVDFTRALFSEDRCGLLEFAPSLVGTKNKTKAIRDGFVAALTAAAPAPDTPAAELLANLRAKQAGVVRDAALARFIDACKARNQQTVPIQVGGATKQVSAFLVDAMKVISHNRRLARKLEVFEFEATMPDDELEVPAGARLHPTTCEITTAFVPVANQEAHGP
jgi:hypothetical protein